MKIRISTLGLIVSQKLTGKKIGLFVVLLLITFASGCSSVCSNSEGFYKDIPRRPMNYREYMSDGIIAAYERNSAGDHSFRVAARF